MHLRKLWTGIVALGLGAGVLAAEGPKPIPPGRFDKIHQLIKPQASELRFQEIPWLLSVHEAQEGGRGGEADPGLERVGRRADRGLLKRPASSGRAPDIWTEQAVRLIKAAFVPLTVDGRIIDKYQDSEVAFLRELKCVANGAHGEAWVISAGGKRLERAEMVPDRKSFEASLRRGLKLFAGLPTAERSAGTVQVPDQGPIDPKRAVAVRPPDGTLIVRVWNRQLGRAVNGELRHTVAEDYIPALRDPSLGFVATKTATELFSQPANDMMWIAKAEWQAMMPANPRKGQRVPVPATLCERLFRFQLDPGRGMGEGDAFSNVNASAGKLELTVEDVSSSEVRLRLDGQAKLFNARDYLKQYQSPGTAKHTQSQFPLDYQPKLLGYLAYDPAKKAFTRIDMVALGEIRGRPIAENVFGERLGESNLLGIAFQLVADPQPADYLAPKGLRNDGSVYDLPRYLGLKK